MHVYTDAAFLSQLFSFTPKVFVGSEELVGGLEILTSGPLAQEVDVWLVINSRTGEDLELWPHNFHGSSTDDPSSTPLMRVEQVPATTCLLAASSPQAKVVLKSLSEWWHTYGAGEPPPLLTSPEKNVRHLDDLATTVIETLLLTSRKDTQKALREQVSLAAQLSALRLEYDEARVAMHGMEEQLLAMRPRLQLYWCLAPNGLHYTPRTPVVITQRLPITASGLIGFDLHSCRSGGHAQDALFVFLEACDVGERLGAWRLPASVLGCGWVRCWLPRALIGLHNELVVRVMWGEGGSGAPSLSLANPGDWPELAAVDNQGSNLGGAIAIAVWSTLPGLALGPASYHLSPLTDDTIEYTLNQDELATLRALTPDIEKSVYLGFPASGGFQLHPLPNQVAAAVLPGACITGVDRITTVIIINNELCRTPISFALLVTRDEYAGYELLTGPSSDSRILAFSGWQEIMPDRQHRPLILEFREPLSCSAHLVFGTRTPLGASTDYAWAQWLGVQLRLRDNHVPWSLTLR